MNTDIYKDIAHWFEGYVQRIVAENEAMKENIQLKEKHILKAVELVSYLATSVEKYTELDIAIAKIVVVLQQIARLNVFANCSNSDVTFAEDDIDDCIAIIKEEKILEVFSEELRNTILMCLSYVNKTLYPKTLEANNIAILKLVNDAGKIAALEILAEYYSEEPQGSNKIIEFHLPNKFEISGKLEKRIMSDKEAEPKDVYSIKDLKLMQMSWVFGLNFKASYKLVHDKLYVKKIYETLPKSDKIIDMYRRMRIHIENQL